MRIDMFPKKSRKHDIDNVFKALCDALTHARAYTDDSEIMHLVATKHPPVDIGRVEVLLQPWTGPGIGQTAAPTARHGAIDKPPACRVG